MHEKPVLQPQLRHWDLDRETSVNLSVCLTERYFLFGRRSPQAERQFGERLAARCPETLVELGKQVVACARVAHAAPAFTEPPPVSACFVRQSLGGRDEQHLERQR